MRDPVPHYGRTLLAQGKYPLIQAGNTAFNRGGKRLR